MRVGVAPAGWLFESAMYDGHDVADEPFELESEDIHGGGVVTFTTEARG